LQFLGISLWKTGGLVFRGDPSLKKTRSPINPPDGVGLVIEVDNIQLSGTEESEVLLSISRISKVGTFPEAPRLNTAVLIL
jgi:hypothetical protein